MGHDTHTPKGYRPFLLGNNASSPAFTFVKIKKKQCLAMQKTTRVRFTAYATVVADLQLQLHDRYCFKKKVTAVVASQLKKCTHAVATVMC